MITLKVHRRADSDTPGAEHVDKIRGWWIEERTNFADLNRALDFLLGLYKRDPECIRAWHEPFYFRGIDATYTGNGDTTLVGGKTASLEGWKMATIASCLARNHMQADRKLNKIELSNLRKHSETLIAKEQLTYKQGLQGRGLKLWQ